MGIFQSSVLQKYIKQLNQEKVDQAYQQFTDYFHNPERKENIKNSKEEQFQEGFLNALFVNILGYTLNPEPNYNLTTEFKNEKGSKKADGAILKDGKALAVIELKGTDTKDLDKINEQAFNYKNNQRECVYVITSNFEKLRFFIHNSVEHLEFNLFELNREAFEQLYLCLHKDHLLGGLPLKIKEESVLAEENISKKLYNDYASFKIELWQNIVKNHPEKDELLLFKKSQKLLDRFLFIFFAEDSGLLPPNSISRMIDRFKLLSEEDAYKPLYEIFKQYFGYINTGRKGKSPQDHIFAYNGGLFRDDPELDELKIDDEVLQPNLLKLSAYDFQSDVDVNILGHIFENSLGEIENIHARLQGQQVDKSKTKRKKDGVFYTPKYITKYIVENTVGKLCEEKKAALKLVDEEYARGRRHRKKETIKKLDQILKAYRKWLLGITICDPACGSGAFLNQALEFLMNEHAYIDELESQLLGYSFEFPGVESHILEKNIYGVDINEESVEIARLSLWLRTAQRGRKLTDLNNNIKCGNSLIDDPEVAGNKAFNWQQEFPAVFKNGGFDVVIGNPPYGATLKLKEKTFIKNLYKISSQGKIDSYKQFFELGFKILKNKGFLSYITPNTFLYNIQSNLLRHFLISNTTITDAVELRKNIFEDAPDVVPVIMSIKKITTDKEYSFRARVAFHNKIYKELEYDHFEIEQLIPTSLIKNDKEKKINLRFNMNFLLVKKKIEKHPNLGNIVNLKQGTKPLGVKGANISNLISNIKHNDEWEKSINGRNISRYYINWENEYVHRSNELYSCLDKEIIQGEKIYFQRMRKISLFPRIVASYDAKNCLHGLYTCSVIFPIHNKNISLKYLLSILNSKLINLWYKYYDTDIEIKLASVKEIPIPNIENNTFYDSLSKKTDIILDLKVKINNVISTFIERLGLNVKLENPSQKINKFYNYDFKTFLAELKKQKVSLSLKEQDEWEDYFNEYKTAINNIQAGIEKTDQEIDQMVYKLYGLTEEEIQIVEEAVK